ncbi:MAG: NAD(P)-dependent oxidoreductase [Oscillospiraceae bacterium]|nr:NAD(P)-dependent oxidoreductase [Oscillospiraceae bacterium]
MATVLVTGASGMIGMYLTSSLLQKKHRVFAVDSRPNEFVGTSPDYTFTQCDITDKGVIENILQTQRIDTLVHLACSVDNDIDSLITDDVLKTSKVTDKYLYEAAVKAGVTNILLLSTTQVYGMQKGREPIRETLDEKGGTYYADMKLYSEKMLMKAVKKADTIPVIARVAPVYTAEYTQNLKDRVYDAKEDVAYIIREGENGFSFCCVFNLVDFINAIVAVPNSRYEGVYNVADSKIISSKEILDYEREHHRIGAVIQKTPPVNLVPLSKSRAKSDYRYFDISMALANWNIDNTKAQRISTFRWSLKNTK